MITLIKLAVIYFVCWAAPVLAGTYWVSPTGSGSWANCRSATDPGSNYCALNTANINAVAGDTVYLKGGTYTESRAYEGAIHPHHSGTGVGTGRIVFAAAPGEIPILTRSGVYMYGLYLGGDTINKYIKIDGITFQNFEQIGLITNYSSYNEITNCTFRNGGGFSIMPGCPGGSSWGCNPLHNWLHHNIFSRLNGSGEACIEGGDTIRIGPAYPAAGGNGETNYNTVENNLIEYGGHSTLESFARFSVFKNNVFHNEPWNSGNVGNCKYPSAGYTNPNYNGKYGHRNLQTADDWVRPDLAVLIEGNRFGYASPNPNNGGAMNYEISGPKQIIRYNSFYGAMNSGLYFKYGSGKPGEPGNPGAGGWGGVYNRVYNNTVYHNGYGYPFAETCDRSPYSYPDCSWYLTGIYGGGSSFGNIVKNNLSYANRWGDIHDSGQNTFTHNWTSSNGNPLFVNPDLSDTSSLDLPNLNLQGSSPAKDGGTYLTTAKGSGGNSVTLVVEDAFYFQDGTWGSILARGVTLFPDWIAIGTVSNVVQISSVNRDTNTITLASPMTWGDGAPIWLYKKSDGTRVLYGSAPDYGAAEYSNGSQLAAPANLRISQ